MSLKQGEAWAEEGALQAPVLEGQYGNQPDLLQVTKQVTAEDLATDRDCDFCLISQYCFCLGK